MSLQAPEATLARRELVLVAVTLVAFARLVERADALLAVVLLPAAVLLAGTAALRGDGRRPFASLLIPAVLTGGAAAAIQLVPAGLAIVPVLALFAIGPRPGPAPRDPAPRPAHGHDASPTAPACSRRPCSRRSSRSRGSRRSSRAGSRSPARPAPRPA